MEELINNKEKKITFSTAIVAYFVKILKSCYRQQSIVYDLEELDVCIIIAAENKLTHSVGFNDNQIEFLSHRLFGEESKKHRSDILINALEKSGLEEEFLAELSEVKTE